MVLLTCFKTLCWRETYTSGACSSQRVRVSEVVQFQRSAVRLDAVYVVPRLQAGDVTAVIQAITPSRTATVSFLTLYT